jgi:outer membrane receptor protein involved in Fe transport
MFYAGVETTWRDLNIPAFNIDTEQTSIINQNEQLHRVYVYITPSKSLALNAEYFFEKFDIHEASASKIETHRIPLTLSYYRPSGLFASVSASYVDQKVNPILADPGEDQFWVVDASLGYRLPKRRGIVGLVVKNMFNEKFRFQDVNFNTDEPLIPLFQPERIISARITLSF